MLRFYIESVGIAKSGKYSGESNRKGSAIMNDLGLFWAMYAPAMQNFFNQFLPRFLSGPADEAQRDGLPIQKIGNVAVITIRGVMVKDSYWYGLSSMSAITKAVNSAIVDDEIEIIILLMDSPGGNVDGLAALGDAVKDAAKVKTVIAQIDGMSASANYYVASQATKIYAGRNDLIGSIGTRILLADYSEYFEKEGIKIIPIDTGEYKSAGATGTKITENQIKDFQRIVDGYFEDFLLMVENGRGMSRKELLNVADGRVFFANDAIQYNLIDGVQTLKETLSEFTGSYTRGRKTQASKQKLRLL